MDKDQSLWVGLKNWNKEWYDLLYTGQCVPKQEFVSFKENVKVKARVYRLPKAFDNYDVYAALLLNMSDDEVDYKLCPRRGRLLYDVRRDKVLEEQKVRVLAQAVGFYTEFDRR